MTDKDREKRPQNPVELRHGRASGAQESLDRESQTLGRDMERRLRFAASDTVLAAETLRRPQIVMTVAPERERGRPLGFLVVHRSHHSVDPSRS